MTDATKGPGPRLWRVPPASSEGPPARRADPRATSPGEEGLAPSPASPALAFAERCLGRPLGPMERATLTHLFTELHPPLGDGELAHLLTSRLLQPFARRSDEHPKSFAELHRVLRTAVRSERGDRPVTGTELRLAPQANWQEAEPYLAHALRLLPQLSPRLAERVKQGVARVVLLEPLKEDTQPPIAHELRFRWPAPGFTAPTGDEAADRQLRVLDMALHLVIGAAEQLSASELSAIFVSGTTPTGPLVGYAQLLLQLFDATELLACAVARRDLSPAADDRVREEILIQADAIDHYMDKVRKLWDFAPDAPRLMAFAQARKAQLDRLL